MFVDEAEFSIKAGNGGDGAVSFRRERYVPRGGPDGGDGGNGGNIIFVGKHDVHTLSAFRSKKHFTAEMGENGMHKKMHGKNGEDTIIQVPLGTVITLLDSSDHNERIKEFDITTDAQTVEAAKGGRGGWGNIHFATSIKQAPAWSKTGLPGEQFQVKLELQLIADVGLVGLPNAGKSTFLSHVSEAKPKIANYPFTTLEPQLGVAKIDNITSIVVADIPGLIEGASTGKGLGIEFLKHIKRTKALLYLLDGTSDDPEKDLKVLQNELKTFDPGLAKKSSLIAINKIDVISSERLKELKKAFPKAHYISGATGEGIKETLSALAQLLK